MEILRRGRIPKDQEDKNFRCCSFPGMEVLPSGRWIASFRAAEKKGDCDFQHAVLTVSDNEGITWSVPREPFKLPDVNGVTGQSRTLYCSSLGGRKVLMVINWIDSSDLSKPFYDPENESLKDTRIFYCFSEDDGDTWSEPLLMDTSMVNGPVPLTGPAMVLKDGTIACQFEVNKYTWDRSKWVHKSALIFSYDGGMTWKEPVLVTNVPDMYYWDQRPNVLADGRGIVDFFWTFDGKRNEYLNIHFAASEDGGRTWGDIRDTGIYGQPGQPVDLGGGRLAAIEIDRSISPVITVRTGNSSGAGFKDSLVIYDSKLDKQDNRNMSMNEAWDEMKGFSVGHPNLVRLGKDRLIAYYYAGEKADALGIEFAVIHI